jgi:small redox-active disulfide protein 2
MTETIMKIVVYGAAGCADCAALHSRVKAVIEKNGIKAELIYNTDFEDALQKEIIQMPALEIDGKLIFAGKIPKEKQILRILEQNDNHIRA